MKRPRYRSIDHTADMAYEVEAPTFEALIEVATAALGDIVLDCSAARLEEEQAIEVAGEDHEDLLVAWLNEVVVRFEVEGFLAWEARVERAEGGVARGRLLGRRLDPESEPPDRVIKAVTYHDLHVVEAAGGRPWRARIVLDL